MTNKLKEPKQPKNKNKCPFGHKWHKDVDQYNDCIYCDKWEDCINNRT